MTNEKRQQLEEKIKTLSIAVSLLVTIGGVVIGIFNYITLNQLSPLSTRLIQVEANQEDVKNELVIYKSNQAIVLDKLATKDQLELVITRLDKVSGRVDQILGVLMK
jgi:hypothetical protein